MINGRRIRLSPGRMFVAVMVLLAAAGTGCMNRLGFGYTERTIEGKPGLDADKISCFSFMGSGGLFSTSSNLAIGNYATLNVGGGNDLFVEEFEFGIRIYSGLDNVRLYAGVGASMGLYMNTIDPVTPEADFGIGALGSIGFEAGNLDTFVLNVEYSVMTNSPEEYGGNQFTVTFNWIMQ